MDEHFRYTIIMTQGYFKEAETCQFLIRGNLAKIGLPQANKFIVQAWEAAKHGHIFQCVSRGKLLKIRKPYEDAEKAYRRVFDECNKQIQEVFTKKRNVLIKNKIFQSTKKGKEGGNYFAKSSNSSVAFSSFCSSIAETFLVSSRKALNFTSRL